MSKRYTVSYERDAESGLWVATIDRSQGVSCVTQGRSLGEARKRIREALALYLDDDQAAERAELVDDVKLPQRIKAAVAKAARLREEANAAQERAQESSAAVARELAAAGVSTRDAAEMLGVSHQLVHKYLAKGEPPLLAEPANDTRRKSDRPAAKRKGTKRRAG